MDETFSREFSSITKTLLNYSSILLVLIYEYRIRSVFLFRINKLFVTWKLTVKRIKTDKSR